MAVEALGGEQQSGSCVVLQTDQGGVEFAIPLEVQVFGLRSDGPAAVHEAWHESGQGRAAPTSADGRVGRHPIQPRSCVVRHAAGARLLDQADECLLEEVLGSVSIPGNPDEEGEQFGPVDSVQRGQQRLVGASISVQPLEGGLRILGCRRLSQVGHAGRTHTSDDCCGVGRVQNDTAGLVLPRSTVCPDRSRYPNQISPGATAARAATRRRVLALAYRVRRANLTLRIRLRRRDDAA